MVKLKLPSAKKKLEPYSNTMPKNPKPKGKMVKGKSYVAADEEYDKKTRKAEDRSMKTAGQEELLMKSEKKKGYSKKPRVKPVKKGY